ncbi:MAG: type II secretion system F family protein [Planctomycetaceae bacterium]|jgi:general secretion pathway protein F/type IV pilus assembly protein PilC|nr:type II secretion system F family protein [Planctomycetaceae bacterium]
MSDFVYTARNAAGSEITGKLTANNRREVLDSLHRLGLFPVTVASAAKNEIKLDFLQRKVSGTLVSAALIQLADLLENGVPVLGAFQVLSKQTAHPVLKNVIDDIYKRVAEGEAIDNAFAVHRNIFDDLTISIIRAGAEGAFLEDALRRTGRFLEQQAELKGKIVGALIYPAILLIVGIAVVLVMLIFFVPKFQPLFDQMTSRGQPLPLPTQSLLWGREILLQYGLYIAGFLAAAAIYLRMQLATAWGIRFCDRLKIQLPLLGEILLNGAVARLCRVLGTLLENGVPILRSLEISSQSTGNILLADAVKRSAESVSSGQPLSKPLSEAGIVPHQVMAMISIAEESNTLETVLVNVADSIERTSARKLDTLVRLIEPLMLLVMGGAVFYIILSLMLPIFNMEGG